MNEPPTEAQVHKILNWCLQCPSLLAPNQHLWPAAEFADTINWQRLSAEQVENIKLASKNKLGGFFETLIKTLFELSDQYHLLAENRIIHGQQRTLGEIDLLIQDTITEQVIHLELAIKFYLWVPQPDATSFNWVGAGLKDFFTDKCQRLYWHQLRLPELAAQQACWPDDLPMPHSHKLWIPGRLYVPEGQTLADAQREVANTPWQLNPQALVSFWRQSTNESAALHKWQWLTGEAGQSNPISAPFQCQWRDNQPLFVVPDNWQTMAQQTITEKNQHNDSI